MTRRAFLVVAGFLALGLPLSAQELRFPSLSLSDNGSFSLASAFTRMETASPDFLPAVFHVANTTAVPRRTTAQKALAEDSSKEVVSDVRRPLFDYAGGEIGVLYGRSTGKFAREFEAGYLMGTVGNEHVQISAGASYERSTSRR
jgi:hypothetical protein